MFTLIVLLCIFGYGYGPLINYIFSMFMTSYKFKNKEELKEAINMLCEDETRSYAEHKYGSFKYWDISDITGKPNMF